MPEEPLVSIHMIAYNAEKFIAAAIESVLNQTYRNIELVIVDDGSTDRTSEIAQSYLSDKRVKYIPKEHSGIQPTRNVAQQNCTGDYIVIVDSDDIAYPQLIETEVTVLQENPGIDAVYTNLDLIGADGRSLDSVWEFGEFGQVEMVSKIFHEGGNVTPFPSLMITRRIADQVGEFDEGFTMSGDSDFVARLARFGRFKRIDQPLYYYRRHSSNISYSSEVLSKKFTKRYRNTHRLLKKMLDLFPETWLSPPPRKTPEEKKSSFSRLGVVKKITENALEAGQYGCEKDYFELAAHFLDGKEAPEKAAAPIASVPAAAPDDPITVLVVGEARNPTTNSLIRFLTRQGHNVHLYDGGVGPVRISGVTRHGPIPAAMLAWESQGENGSGENFVKLLISHTLGVIQAIHTARPQIVHGIYLSLWGQWASFAGFQPFVLSPLGPDLGHDIQTSPLVRNLNLQALTHTAAVVTDSAAVEKDAIRHMGDSKDVTRVPMKKIEDQYRRFLTGFLNNDLQDGKHMKTGLRHLYRGSPEASLKYFCRVLGKQGISDPAGIPTLTALACSLFPLEYREGNFDVVLQLLKQAIVLTVNQPRTT